MKGLLIDQNNCVGCFACLAACAMEHNTNVDTSYIQVKETEILEAAETKLSLLFEVSIRKGCDLCAIRLKSREKTSCEQHCVSQCITSGGRDELEKLMETMNRPYLFLSRKTMIVK